MMNVKMHQFLLTGAAGVLSLAGMAQAAYLNDFSDTSKYDATTPDGWNINGTGSAWSSSNGVGGVSGRVNLSVNPFTAVNLDNVFALTVGQSVTLSEMVLFGDGGTINRTGARIGLTSASNDYFATSYVATEIRHTVNATPDTGIIRIVGSTGVTTTTSGTYTVGAGGNVAIGDWCKLTLVVTRNANDSLTLDASLANYGSTGTSLTPTTLATASFTTGASFGLATDNSVYAAMGTPNGTVAYSQAIDNFTVAVPEPASLALLGMAGLLMLPRRKHA